MKVRHRISAVQNLLNDLDRLSVDEIKSISDTYLIEEQEQIEEAYRVSKVSLLYTELYEQARNYYVQVYNTDNYIPKTEDNE